MMEVKRTSFAIKRFPSYQVFALEWESILEKIALITRAKPFTIAYNVPSTISTNIPNVISDSFIERFFQEDSKG
jgi:hypothetical protein